LGRGAGVRETVHHFEALVPQKALAGQFGSVSRERGRAVEMTDWESIKSNSGGLGT
jgi:hypothetical protein